jgi:hypothetical protein
VETVTARRTSGAWYLIGVGLMISAATMAGIAYGSMKDGIEGMQRVVMPGRAEITVPAGTSTLYVEEHSVVGGKTYEVSDAFQFRCDIDEKQRKVSMTKPMSTVSYSIGDFAGHNAIDVDVVQAGGYMLACQAEKPFVIAVGRGIGKAIVVAIIGIGPFLVGLAIVVFVFFKRRSQQPAKT